MERWGSSECSAWAQSWELAAAQAAGVYGLEEGVRFAAARGELTAKLPQGAMAAIFADVSQVEAAIDELNAASAGVGLSIAAYNGAHQVVSGPEEEVVAIEERFLAEDVRVNRLRTNNAFHSPLVEPMLDGLETVVGGMEIALPSLTLVSNVTGGVLESDGLLDGTYWRKHTREPVAFAPSMGTLAELGVDLIIEVGPHAVLGSMATLAWPNRPTQWVAGCAVELVAHLVQGVQERSRPAFTAAVVGAYEAGLSLSFAGLFPGETRRRVALPDYPFLAPESLD